MNYLDIAVVAMLALGLFFGLFGKAGNKIISTIFMVAAVGASWVLAPKLAAKLTSMSSSMLAVIGGSKEKTIAELLADKINGLIGGSSGIDPDTLTALVNGVLAVIAFWLLSIALMILFGIISKIICSIAFRNAKKGSAIKTLGLFGLIKAFVLTVVILFPVIVFSPVLKSATQINDSELFQTIEAQAQGSKALEISDKFLEKNHISLLEYKKGEEKRYLFDDIKSIPGLFKLAKLFGSGNADETIKNMSDEDIRAMLEAVDDSDTVKELITGVFEAAAPGMNIDLSEVDLSEEADAIIAVKELATKDPAELTEEDITGLVDDLADSKLVLALAEANEGMLSGIDSDTKDDITSQLNTKLADGKLSQDDYDSMMKLFNAKASE